MSNVFLKAEKQASNCLHLGVKKNKSNGFSSNLLHKLAFDMMVCNCLPKQTAQNMSLAAQDGHLVCSAYGRGSLTLALAGWKLSPLRPCTCRSYLPFIWFKRISCPGRLDPQFFLFIFFF